MLKSGTDKENKANRREQENRMWYRKTKRKQRTMKWHHLTERKR